MHLLRTQPGAQLPADSIADLGQTPADLVILCTGDSHLSLLAEAARQLPGGFGQQRQVRVARAQDHQIGRRLAEVGNAVGRQLSAGLGAQ